MVLLIVRNVNRTFASLCPNYVHFAYISAQPFNLNELDSAA